jgi:membrane associated rhomboid family serine protease
MRSTFSDGPRRLFQESYNPLTNAIIVAWVIVFLSVFLRLPIVDFMVARMPIDILQPWRWLTFAFVITNIISLIFSGLALWWVGGSLERSWGSRTFGILFGLLAIITALSFVPIGYMSGANVLAPSGLVIASLVVCWCMINPDETINLYGIIPIKSRFIAIGIFLIVFFSYGMSNPLNGLLALISCGFAAAWARNGWAYRFAGANQGYGYAPPKKKAKAKVPNLRLVPPVGQKPKDDRFSIRDLNPFEFFAKRKRRKQFEKLMRDD